MLAQTSRRFPLWFILAGAAAGLLALGSCGGDDGPAQPSTPRQPAGGTGGTGDFVKLSVGSGSQNTYTEASGLPDIDCDPRVDWSASQIVMWQGFSGGNGPNGYDLFMDIMFPNADSVGIYTVQGDFLQVLFYNGDHYTASPILPFTSGTVQVTRSDTRIEGTFTFTMAESTGTLLDVDGSFGVDKGFSLSCP